MAKILGENEVLRNERSSLKITQKQVLQLEERKKHQPENFQHSYPIQIQKNGRHLKRNTDRIHLQSISFFPKHGKHVLANYL